jgi:hypothetical protein
VRGEEGRESRRQKAESRKQGLQGDRKQETGTAREQETGNR